jgi:hypothetical protein
MGIAASLTMLGTIREGRGSVGGEYLSDEQGGLFFAFETVTESKFSPQGTKMGTNRPHKKRLHLSALVCRAPNLDDILLRHVDAKTLQRLCNNRTGAFGLPTAGGAKITILNDRPHNGCNGEITMHVRERVTSLFFRGVAFPAFLMAQTMNSGSHGGSGLPSMMISLAKSHSTSRATCQPMFAHVNSISGRVEMRSA